MDRYRSRAGATVFTVLLVVGLLAVAVAVVIVAADLSIPMPWGRMSR